MKVTGNGLSSSGSNNSGNSDRGSSTAAGDGTAAVIATTSLVKMAALPVWLVAVNGGGGQGDLGGDSALGGFQRRQYQWGTMLDESNEPLPF